MRVVCTPTRVRARIDWICLLSTIYPARCLDPTAVRRDAERALSEGHLKLARSTLKSAVAELQREETEPTQANIDLWTDLGKVYSRMGQEIEAVGALDAAVEATSRVHGQGDPRYAMALDKLADAHMRSGSSFQAMQLYTEVLSLMRKGFGKSHPGYQITLGKAAQAAQKAGKHRKATHAFDELLKLVEEEHAKSNQAAENLGMIHLQYATALAAAGKLTDALAQANQAQETYEQSGLNRSMDHAAAFNGIAGILEKLNRDEEAVAAMAKALEIAQNVEDAGTDIVRGAQKNLDGLKAHVLRKKRTSSSASLATEL